MTSVTRNCFCFFFLLTVACTSKEAKYEIQEMRDAEEIIQETTQSSFLVQMKQKTSIMQKAARESLNYEEREIEAEKLGWEKRKIILRYDIPGQPVVMEVTEPTDAGKMTGLSIFYYQDGDLFAVTQPYANYILEKGKLKIWTDENWNENNEISVENWLDRENNLVEQSENYLKLFDINL
ncbi:hypothetical protein [Pararhodonellum marinum]|uniref:hypothetical protein n=1 Tax=Pararhodonellum marinum TaxID=2755358 RepID=UPI00188F0ED3|nr:hypothetical protein [Pararhodonellum marinum]